MHTLLVGVAGGPLVLLAVVAATRVAGADGTLAIVILHAVLPWILLPAWPALTAAVLTRRWAIAGVAGLVAVGHAGWTLPLAVPEPLPVSRAATNRLRLATVNLFAANDRVAALAPVLAEIDADVVVFQELTPRHHRTLAAAGALDGYGHAIAVPRLGSIGSAIYSRIPLEQPRVLHVGGAPMAAAHAVVGDTTFQIVSVHVTSPFNDVRAWNRQLDALRDIVDGRDAPVVLAGDFNATRDHRGLRALLRRGVSDAHDAAGEPDALTWPAARLRLPLLVRIDRVLVSDDIGVRAARTVRIPGSDHKGVVVDLAVP